MDQETLEYATKVSSKVLNDYMVANQANVESAEYKSVVKVTYKILEELRKPLGELIRAKNAAAAKKIKVTEEVVATAEVEVVEEEKPKKIRKKKVEPAIDDEF